MRKTREQLYAGMLTEIQEEALNEVMEMDSKTLDSLLCNVCLKSGNAQQCNKLMQFKNSAKGSKNEDGEIGNMIYLHRICGYTLSKYQENKGK